TPGGRGRPVAGPAARVGPGGGHRQGQPAQGRPRGGGGGPDLGQYGDQGAGGARPAVAVPVVAEDGNQQSLGTGAADRAGSTPGRGCPVLRDLVLLLGFRGFHGLPPVAGPGAPARATPNI